MWASLGIVLTVLLTSACSRQEKPVAPAATKAKGVESAPAVERHEQPIAFTNKAPAAALSEHKGSAKHVFPEKEQEASMNAMMKRRKANAEKVIGRELAKAEAAYDRERQELDKKEAEVREKDPAVRDAYAKVLAVRNEYEDACVKFIPGYGDTVKESVALRAGLEDFVARKNRGDSIDSNQMTVVYRRVNEALLKISQMRGSANAGVPEVAKALQNVVQVQNAYEQSLLNNDEYGKAKVKLDNTSIEITRLTSMQERK